MKRKGSTTSIVIATIAGLSVLGVAGYRMMSGECSTCPLTGAVLSAQTVTTQTVATKTVDTPSTGDSCCALKAGGESAATLVAAETVTETPSACCGDAGAKVEQISTTAEPTAACCQSEKAEALELVKAPQ